VRVSNNLIHKGVQSRLQRNLASIYEANLRVTTGLRINKPSDDPASAAEVMATDRRIRALDQYRRNIDSAAARVNAAEGVLDQLGDILSRARELGMAQGGDTASAATRQTAKAEVDQLLQTVIQLGNTRFGDAYLFGGAHADLAPLADDGTVSATTPPVGDSPVALDFGQSVLTVHDAQSLFLDSGAISALQHLSGALGANDAEEIRTATAELVSAFDATQTRIGEIGARSQRLESARANIDALEASAKIQRSGLAEVDFEQAVTELLNRQTAYQAALMATSRILNTTLAEYLR